MIRTKNKQYYYKCWATCALKTYMHLQTCMIKQITSETYQLHLCFFNFNSSLRNVLKKLMPNFASETCNNNKALTERYTWSSLHSNWN